MAYFRCMDPMPDTNSFWDEYDNIIRRSGYSSSLAHYNSLKTMTFTGVPSDCTRVLVQSYYSNYIVHFLRASDTLTPDNAHHIPFGEWYRTNAFTPSDNSSQAVTLHQADAGSYIPLPGATDYGTDVVINMNSFPIVENDAIVVPINCEYSDFTTTAPV